MLLVWADNETEVDLLGYEFLVDSLVVALTEPRLLPLTLGVLGDWGSGKSSLMIMARLQLEKLSAAAEEEASDGQEPGRYVCVPFSPWRHQDFEDVKVALMSAVLDRLAQEITEPEDEQHERIGRLSRFKEKLRASGRWVGRTTLAGVPAAVTAAAAYDPTLVPVEVLPIAQAVVGAAVSEGQRALASSSAKSTTSVGTPTDVEITNSTEFHRQFEELVENLTGVRAVVVFIDDLDRCLPDAVVDTFEAIRLFLNSSKTAYVVAANQAVVEAAIDSRYPELRRDDGVGIGADYLEKMLQLKIAIPALAVPEAETYVNLLLADLWLGPEEFATVLESTQKLRAGGELTVAFNLGIAAGLLNAVPDKLARDLGWAAEITPSLATGLRGNPRQIKRFLNTLMLRHRSAALRGVVLRPDVLAKLQILEEQHFPDFKRLFDWQLGAEGIIPELAQAEGAVLHVAAAETDSATSATSGSAVAASKAGSNNTRANDGGSERPSRVRKASAPPKLRADVQAWTDKEHVRHWLALEPRLGATNLRPYFTYSRDKLSLGVAVSRMPQHLQALLRRVQDALPATRRAAIGDVAQLPPHELAQLVDGLMDRVGRNPGGPGTLGAVELADRIPDTAATIVQGLLPLPPSAVPGSVGTAAVRRLAGVAGIDELLDKWAGGDNTALASAVRAARRPST
ncbi:P-loop NTPase fold protein [Dactylosporangium sp. NPDC000244]|uniref:P-loop NTPase fold protein n=1 Tax=Dactylosporangium sp. NPDC000244 TaxID=3154365 RepID=UPI003318CDC5